MARRRLRDRLGRHALARQDTSTARAPRVAVGGRLTIEGYVPALKFPVMRPPLRADELWRTLHLDSETLQHISVERLILLLCDLSPQFSKALWDALRMCNAGFSYKVLEIDPNSETELPDARALVDSFLATLKSLYGLDVLINRIFASGLVRGAFFVELVLGPGGREPIDLVTPDPITVRFQLERDPLRGDVWRLYQWVMGEPIPLDRPTIRYVPIDPLPGGAPYGRSPFTAAIVVSLFILTFIHDIRRVVAQAGYSHMDFTVNSEILSQYMPQEIRNDPAKVQEWTDQVLADLDEQYGDMEPEDAVMHTDVLKVDRTPPATADIRGASDLLQTLQRIAVQGLKTMPIALGLTDGVSEANANRQWEMLVRGYQALQHHVEGLMEELLALALRAQGVQARVVWRFAQVRASEELRDEQTTKFRGENATLAELMGWMSHEEASRYVTAHGPYLPEPQFIPQNFVPWNATTGADQGTSTGPDTVDLPTENVLDGIDTQTLGAYAAIHRAIASANLKLSISGTLSPAPAENGVAHHEEVLDAREEVSVD